jgi:hypothetical protein
MTLVICPMRLRANHAPKKAPPLSKEIVAKNKKIQKNNGNQSGFNKTKTAA